MEFSVVDRNAVLSRMDEQHEMMEDKIQLGIEANRKGFAKLKFMDRDGKPLSNVKVSIKQKNHAFKFGCNFFKYKCFASEEENALYEERFKKLFNLAVIPFYWKDFEPTNGQMRFEKSSVFIDRRPPSELCLEFCRENGIEPKGHPLFWGTHMPEWLPKDWEQVKHYLVRRLKAIGERYDGIIKSFDCVNEVTSLPVLTSEVDMHSSHYRNLVPMPGSYTEEVFKLAERYFAESHLILNETGGAWTCPTPSGKAAFHLLIDSLLRKGCRIDEIGLQYHVFTDADGMKAMANTMFNPHQLYSVMDAYGEFGKPLSVSELTINGYDEAVQEELVYNLYRIWFSHPAVSSIVYWNLGENCAIESGNGWSEKKYKGGLIRDDFSERPSYRVLDRLINKEWHTEIEKEAVEGSLWFKGFYGDYEIKASCSGHEIVRDIRLIKGGFDEFSVII